MKLATLRHLADQIAAYRRAGWWTDATTADALERHAREQPERLAIADARVRLAYAEYARRSERLTAHFVALGLTGDDVIALNCRTGAISPSW